jgi:DNA (cytosine-5)-methyltransferase 1
MPYLARRPIAIDLFAGAGGFSLGIEQAGFDVAVAVEQDPVHAAVYAFNFPHTKVLRADVSTLSGRAIADAVSLWVSQNGQDKSWDGKIDLVFGGPPCQGFSMIGKGLVDDVRNNLVFEFCRLVKELQPRYFAMENVPGLCRNKYSSVLNRLLNEFKAVGYEITEPLQILNAANFGVPQKRQRLFLLGAKVGCRALAYPEPELREGLGLGTVGAASVSKRSKARLSRKESPSQYITVRDAIADLPNLDDFAELHSYDCLQLTAAQLHEIEASATLYVKKLRDLISDRHNFAYLRQWNPQQLTSSMQTHHGEIAIERFNQTPPGKLEPISRLRRLSWNKPCYTLRAGTGYERGSYTSPRPIHPHYPRVISVREAARLHSFPDWFRFHTTKWHGFRQVGNAVPPLLARALGRQILTVMEVEPSIPTATLQQGDSQLLTFTLLKASNYWKALESQLPPD